MTITLHGYWRSSASYRVRLAANLKGLAYDQVSYDLRQGEQRTPALRRMTPLGLVPVLEVDRDSLTQSLAILEWLEEVYPTPPLLPADATPRQSLLDSRWELDPDSKRGTFRFTPYKPVYFLPYFHSNNVNGQPTSPAPGHTAATPEDIDSNEAKLQFGFKTKLWENVFGGKDRMCKKPPHRRMLRRFLVIPKIEQQF